MASKPYFKGYYAILYSEPVELLYKPQKSLTNWVRDAILYTDDFTICLGYQGRKEVVYPLPLLEGRKRMNSNLLANSGHLKRRRLWSSKEEKTNERYLQKLLNGISITEKR